MSVALTQPWTEEAFLDWASRQDEPYEFDGLRPVAMTGGNANHDRVTLNIHISLRARLRGTRCSHHGPNLGVRTTGGRIRYPDALITCTKFPGTERIAPDVVVVFEVISPRSGGMDRITKLREYQAVPSILRYVIVESTTAGLQVLHRDHGDETWRVQALTSGDSLGVPEVGTEIPVADIYEDVAFEEVLPFA